MRMLAGSLIELAGVIPHLPQFSIGQGIHADGDEEGKAKKRRQWPDVRGSDVREIEAIAEFAGLSIEGVSLAAEVGLLQCADSQ